MKRLLKDLRKSFDDMFDSFDEMIDDIGMDELEKKLDERGAETITEHETRPDGTRITRTITRRTATATTTIKERP